MTFDFIETGTGPAILFLPGSYSTHAAWRGLQRALTGSYRLISTSLPEYGGTGEVRDASVGDVELMTDFVAGVADRAAEPVHLVGHSWGGLVAFASALSGKVRPLSLVTFEGNPLYARRGGQPFPWIDDVRRTTDRFETAHAAGDPDAAAIIIDYYAQPGSFDAMPEAFRDYCRAKASTNLLDWRAAAGFTPEVADFAALDIPCTIVRGADANRAVADVTDAISQAIPGSTSRVVDGAGHFLISTHPEACAALVDAHMDGLV
jgi:pimeloyl-ACP methyl ester carboxylesterase